jgi:DEAD_2
MHGPEVTDIEDLGELCSFYEGFSSRQDSFRMPNGVFTLDDLREFGKQQGMCPYFLARHYLLQANVIVYSYSEIALWSSMSATTLTMPASRRLV